MNFNADAFVALTIRRPVTVVMILFTIIIVGVIAWTRIPLELAPSGFVSTEITVEIPVPNSNPNEVEKQVTKPTEEVLRQISGKDHIMTSSSKDNSRIRVSFSKNRDPDEAFAELRDLMEVAKLSWPDDVREYRTWRFNLDSDLPVYSFGVLLDKYDVDTPFLIDEKIRKEIESVDGVARCEIWGIVEDAIFISIDRAKAQGHNVSLFTIAQALGADNRDVIGGKIEEAGQSFFLRSTGRFRDLDEIRAYPVRPDLRLGDIAEVQSKQAYRNFVFRLNGRPSIWCMVNKEANANTVDVSRRIREHLDQKITKDARLAELGWGWFRPELRDIGHVITSALENLLKSALLGGLLAIIPLFYFLRRWRLVTIITFGIPSSLLITLGWVYFSGGTLNILTMLGLTISTGMLVDNSIVVVESILRWRQLGLSAREAALRGAGDVALANTIATFTTVVAFLPLIFMSADANVTVITKGIGLPICYAVLSSLAVSLLFIPLATAYFCSKSDGRGSGDDSSRVAASTTGSRPRSLMRLLDRGFDSISGFNVRWLSWSLQNRFLSLVIVTTCVALPTKFALDAVAQADIVDDTGGNIRIEVQLEPNFTLSDANDVFNTLYDSVRAIDAEAISDPELGPEPVRLGIDYVFHFFDRQRGSLSMGLIERSAEHAKKAVKILNKRLPKIPGVRTKMRVESQNEDRGGLRFSIFGNDVDTLVHVAKSIGDEIETLPDVQAVRSSVAESTEELVVRPDRERLQLLGVDPRALMGTVSWGIRGQRLPDFQAGDQRVQLFIEFSDREDTNALDLENMGVITRSGRTLPLSNLADVYYSRGYGTIRKLDGRASLELTVDTLSEDTKALEATIAAKLEKWDFPEGYSFRSTSAEEQGEGRRELLLALFLSLALVYIVMAVLFDHLLLPFCVMIGALFALPGFLITLWATRTAMDMVSLIGGFVLAGVAVNNGIVFLDCAHRLRRDGMDIREALVEAARRRLRPILMTTGTTVIGLLPMSFVAESGSFISYTGLARGIAGGLLLSTVCTLVIVPIMYTFACDLTRVWLQLFGRASATTEAPARAVTEARLGTSTPE